MTRKQNSGVQKFQQLFHAMLTKDPRPLEKSTLKRQTSTVVDDANYGDIQIPEDKFEDASLKPKYVSP